MVNAPIMEGFMKKILFTTAFIALTTNAFANDESFLRLEGGLANSQKVGKDFRSIQPNADADKSGFIALGIGGPMDNNLSFTIVGEYRPKHYVSAQDNVDKYSADLKSYGARANLYYSMRDLGSVAPYVTVGAGVSQNRLDKLNVAPIGSATPVYQYSKKHKTEFMYQAGFGIDLELSNEAILDIGYRYTDLGKFQTGTKRTTVLTSITTDVERIGGRLRSHDIMVGLKYKL